MINHRPNYRLVKKLRNSQPIQDLNVYTYNERRDVNGKITWAQVGIIEKTESIEGVTIKPGWIK